MFKSPYAMPVPKNLEEVLELADVFAKSGVYKDALTKEKAAVKIMTGLELGIAPTAAMKGVYIMEAKGQDGEAGSGVAVAAKILAGLVKLHGYEYKIVEHTNEICRIEFLGQLKPDGTRDVLGESKFDKADQQTAWLGDRKTWKKFPRNMNFSRSISNGTGWFLPEMSLGAGPIHTPDELDERYDSEGQLVEEEIKDKPGKKADEFAVGVTAAPIMQATIQPTPQVVAALAEAKSEAKAEVKTEPKKAAAKPKAEPKPEPTPEPAPTPAPVIVPEPTAEEILAKKKTYVTTMTNALFRGGKKVEQAELVATITAMYRAWFEVNSIADVPKDADAIINFLEKLTELRKTLSVESMVADPTGFVARAKGIDAAKQPDAPAYEPDEEAIKKLFPGCPDQVVWAGKVMAATFEAQEGPTVGMTMVEGLRDGATNFGAKSASDWESIVSIMAIMSKGAQGAWTILLSRFKDFGFSPAQLILFITTKLNKSFSKISPEELSAWTEKSFKLFTITHIREVVEAK